MLYSDTKSKIANVKATIDTLLAGDFPLTSGERALKRISKVFGDFDSKLDRAFKINSLDSVKLLAENVNTKIYRVLPILGFILRSTNVRNSFELLEPFQVLANCMLEGISQVIISSEWDYVPFAYPQSLEDLQSFVLIGMPASEAGNALLIPLAAHELGHAVWRNRGIEGAVTTTLQIHCENLYKGNMQGFRRAFPNYNPNDLQLKEILPEAIANSVYYAGLQAEELFCDMIAYALFGESYLRAFAYILAPGSPHGPSPKYPTYRTRLDTLFEIGQQEGVVLPRMADLQMSDVVRRGRDNDKFMLQMAESSVDAVKPGLWNQAISIVSQKSTPRPSSHMAAKHLRELRLGIPAHSPECVGDIINAGWQYHSEIIRSQQEVVEQRKKLSNMNEIIFKTIEVLEFKRRTGSGA